MTYGTARAGVAQQGAEKQGHGWQQQDPSAPGPRWRARRAAVQAQLGVLFPVADRQPPARPLASAAFQVAVVCAGAIALLLRVPRTPAWDSLYGEDNGEFLVGALTHPWHLFVPYAGYEQLGPRLIGQLIASFLPLVDAARGYAVAGALIGAASSLFIYHASEGYIQSRWLRALAATSLLLLPIATADIADSGVDSPWYPMAALFFAALWRPRSWPGMLAAALIAFYATSSEIVGLIYAPLLLIRLVALPRWREQAVTAGWLAGLLVQLPVVLQSYAQGAQRLNSGNLSTPGQAVAFYFHNVVLRALGWKLSLDLKHVAGYNGATVIVGVLLAIGIGWAMIVGGRQVRFFAVIALLLGFVQTFTCETITSYLNVQRATTFWLPAARYSTIPIVAIDAIVIVGVDVYLRTHGPVQFRPRPRALIALVTLTCVLSFGWISDFRDATPRSFEGNWRAEARSWLHRCEHSHTGEIKIPAWQSPDATLDCSRLNR